jgi:hypothetical protein
MKRAVAFIVGIFVGLCTWLRSLFGRRVRPLRTIHVEELPEMLDREAVYVLGEGKHRWFVAMACPCGCGSTLQVSLLPDATPRWRLVEHRDDGTITLEPSVWRDVGCRSHFFLRRGLVQWCE